MISSTAADEIEHLHISSQRKVGADQQGRKYETNGRTNSRRSTEAKKRHLNHLQTPNALAYMLFTPGPDEAVEPLILGFSSAALILSAQEPTFVNAVILVVLVAGISVLFWVRKGFVDSERD